MRLSMRWARHVVPVLLVCVLLAGCGGGEMKTQSLAVSGELAVKFIAAFENGSWNNMGGGFDTGSASNVRVVKRDPATGRLWIGGQMTLDGTVYRVCTYDPVSGLQGVADGPDDGYVFDILIHPDGTVYFVGTFTTCTATTVACKYICQYDGTDWAAVGNGASTGSWGTAGIWSIDMNPATGKIYVGGNFWTLGGTAAYCVAEWDGTSWAALGTATGLNGAVNKVSVHAGWLYTLGIFTTTNGGSVSGLNRFAKFELSVSSEWAEASDSGFNDTSLEMSWLTNGTAIIGGSFTTANGVTVNRLALFNGSSLSPLGDGTGANGTVRDLAARSDGATLIIGDFTSLGGMTIADYCGLWNGSSYSPLTIDLPGTPTTYTADVVDVGGNIRRDMYIGFSTEGDAEVSQNTTVSNEGTAVSWPKITIERAGGTTAVLESIVNHETGDRLIFDHSMVDGERLVIDLKPGSKTITSRVGSIVTNALDDLLPESDISTFCLIPGDNNIEVYISNSGSPTITAFIQWNVEHDSIDGGAG